MNYSSMPNMEGVIKRHNTKIFSTNNNTGPEGCNCRRKNECPLKGSCLTNSVVYKAKVSSTKIYIGMTEHQVKTRFNGLKVSFRHRAHEHDTALSKYIWNLRTKTSTTALNGQLWQEHVRACNLCLMEKFHILKAEKSSLLFKVPS